LASTADSRAGAGEPGRRSQGDDSDVQSPDPTACVRSHPSPLWAHVPLARPTTARYDDPHSASAAPGTYSSSVQEESFFKFQEPSMHDSAATLPSTSCFSPAPRPRHQLRVVGRHRPRRRCRSLRPHTRGTRLAVLAIAAPRPVVPLVARGVGGATWRIAILSLSFVLWLDSADGLRSLFLFPSSTGCLSLIAGARRAEYSQTQIRHCHYVRIACARVCPSGDDAPPPSPSSGRDTIL
jgi:hypothetical protein